MNKLVMAVVIVAEIIFCDQVIAQSTSFSGINVPNTKISNISQMVLIVDKEVDNYLEEKISSDKLAANIEKYVVLSSRQSGVKIESIFKKLEKIYNQQEKDADEKITECKKNKKTEEGCAQEIHKYVKTEMALTGIKDAQMKHYVGSPKEIIRELEDDGISEDLNKASNKETGTDDHYWRNKLKERLSKDKK